MSILYISQSATIVDITKKISRIMVGKSTEMVIQSYNTNWHPELDDRNMISWLVSWHQGCWLTGFFTFSLNSEEMPVVVVMRYFEMIQCVMSWPPGAASKSEVNKMKYSNLIWSIWSKSRINSIETFSINFLLCIHLEKYRDLILITMQSLKKIPILSQNFHFRTRL